MWFIAFAIDNWHFCVFFLSNTILVKISFGVNCIIYLLYNKKNAENKGQTGKTYETSENLSISIFLPHSGWMIKNKWMPNLKQKKLERNFFLSHQKTMRSIDGSQTNITFLNYSGFQPFLSLRTINRLFQCLTAPIDEQLASLKCNNWWQPWSPLHAH